MNRIFFAWMLLGILGSQYSRAQVTENFNPRAGVAITQLKGYLQNHCWTITDLDLIRANTGKELNGVLMSGPLSTTNTRTGLYTPVLDVPGELTVSCSFILDDAVKKGTQGLLKVFLTDANNVVVKQLDSIDLSAVTAGSLYNYNKSFTGLQRGAYKLFLNPKGTVSAAHIAIDQVTVSAPLHYAGGCNTSPVATNDNINGLPNRVASGQVISNDKDADQDGLSAYLVNNSPDGTVSLKPDGSFTFTPNPGFTGHSTTFSYRVCDNGSGKLCSQDAKVTLNFPSEAISLNDLKGLYNGNGDVAISWATSYELNSNRFEIERSLDGVKWHKAGTVKAQGISTVEKKYDFTDEVGRNAALKKDLYYRLKQIDSEGNVATSRLLVVRVYNTRALKMMSVTPNPAKNDIAVTTQLNETSFVAMKIFNANGAVVLNKALKAHPGAYSFVMEGSSHLQPGEYTLDVTVNSKERMMVKLIKE